MTRDRRGFHYPLEPVRNMTEWELNDMTRELAAQNEAAAAQQYLVKHLSDCLATARANVIAQRQAQALLDIHAQRLAHAYMVQVQEKLVTENEKLRHLQKERDDTFKKLNELRKFAESLDRNKESALEEHDRNMVKQAYQQADDSWVQRIHWRKKQ